MRGNQGLNYDTLRSYTLDITCIDQRRNDSSVFYIYLLRNKPPRFLNLQGILIINKPPILEIRRKIKRLCLFQKAFNHQVAIQIPDYIKQQNRTTRQYHPRTFRNVQTSSNTYKYSFFPRTIKDWNNLPSTLLNMDDVEAFKTSFTSYLTE